MMTIGNTLPVQISRVLTLKKTEFSLASHTPFLYLSHKMRIGYTFFIKRIFFSKLRKYFQKI